MLKVFLLLLLGEVFCQMDLMEGWNYINLHCRNNFNKPVDWWYIYKPPSDDPIADVESGKNFTFITPDSGGKWEQSPDYITANTMLRHTLSPMFRKTYSDHLAILVYHSNKGTDELADYGFMMADEQGGVWIGHTVPGFPDMFSARVPFPENEVPNGHMFVCLSLNLPTLNRFAASIKITQPNVTHLVIPPRMRKMLPHWSTFLEPDKPEKLSNANSIMTLDFSSHLSTVRGSIIVHRPEHNQCLYKAFARSKSIVLDVYGHDRHWQNICNNDYSVRSIEAISLKFPENIRYINNKTDHSGFAVSTAAHWQRSGANKEQYWTCTKSIHQKDNSKGGLIVCIEDYDVWRSFDTLKVKEPVC